MANKLTLNLSKLNMLLIQPKNLNNKVNFSTVISNFVPEISTARVANPRLASHMRLFAQFYAALFTGPGSCTSSLII